MNDSLAQEPLIFSQIHIEVARNSTDDFNLFHDKNKWQRIHGNPFGGPIALGFQLECLIEYQIRCYRIRCGEDVLIKDNNLRYSNYQFNFVNVVRAGESIFVEIKKSQLKTGDNCILSNRVLIKNKHGVVLMGHKKESEYPLFLSEMNLSGIPELSTVPDRSYIEDQPFFLKRKFINTGNAKNFLSGSLAEQSDYFDELEEKICFPETFPVSLTSCALLERALKEKYDFERVPMVYTTHNISVDRKYLKELKSNDVLHLLVKQPKVTSGDKGLGKSGLTQHVYQCFGVKDNSIIFRAEISLAPLDEIIKTSESSKGSRGQST
jgi:hypothetical protein